MNLHLFICRVSNPAYFSNVHDVLGVFDVFGTYNIDGIPCLSCHRDVVMFHPTLIGPHCLVWLTTGTECELMGSKTVQINYAQEALDRT